MRDPIEVNYFVGPSVGVEIYVGTFVGIEDGTTSKVCVGA
jgi:hypothetical protein